jgi:hypothetical protein
MVLFRMTAGMRAEPVAAAVKFFSSIAPE